MATLGVKGQIGGAGRSCTFPENAQHQHRYSVEGIWVGSSLKCSYMASSAILNCMHSFLGACATYKAAQLSFFLVYSHDTVQRDHYVVDQSGRLQAKAMKFSYNRAVALLIALLLGNVVRYIVRPGPSELPAT